MRPAVAALLRAAGGLAALAVAALVAWAGWDALARQPIAAVRFTGEAARVNAGSLERLAAGLRGREAREVALADVRDAVRRLAWVRDCSVRRVLPGTIEVAIEAHEPLARWDETRLVSVRGEVFAADHEGELPRFAGPEGTAAEIAAAWTGISRISRPLGSPVAELALSARRAWQARLASGLVIELGRGDVHSRLARFAAAWPQVAQGAAAATHADLRYPGGFALRGAAAGREGDKERARGAARTRSRTDT
jgi:cell division protein FtsQ